MEHEIIRHIEALTARVWPAAETGNFGGWAAGLDAGVTGRANSVLPNAWTGDLAVEDAIREAERRYAAHGLDTLFKLTGASLPEGLDGMLAARGYVLRGAPVTVMTVRPEILRDTCPRNHPVRHLEAPTRAWCEAAGWAGSEREIRLAIARRIAPPRSFALVEENGAPVGAAILSASGEWACICSLNIVPARRSQGFGRSIMAELATWAPARGARRIFLQVEGENSIARSLYERLGWERAYDYHYRRKPRT